MRYGSIVASLLALLVFGTLSVGCSTAPPERVPMTTQLTSEFVGERTVDYVLHWTDEVQVDEGFLAELMKSMGLDMTSTDEEDDEEIPHHLGIQVCDVVDGAQQNCNETRVLDFVLKTPTRSYQPRMDGVRRITNMFWFDSETLYISYLEYPEGEPKIRSNSTPKMKMCRMNDGNAMSCEDQTEFAELLQWTETD